MKYNNVRIILPGTKLCQYTTLFSFSFRNEINMKCVLWWFVYTFFYGNIIVSPYSEKNVLSFLSKLFQLEVEISRYLLLMSNIEVSSKHISSCFSFCHGTFVLLRRNDSFCSLWMINRLYNAKWFLFFHIKLYVFKDMKNVVVKSNTIYLKVRN